MAGEARVREKSRERTTREMLVKRAIVVVCTRGLEGVEVGLKELLLKMKGKVCYDFILKTSCALIREEPIPGMHMVVLETMA